MAAPEESIKIGYDAETKIVTIDGLKFSREVFLTLAGAAAIGTAFRILTRKDGVVTLERIQS